MRYSGVGMDHSKLSHTHPIEPQGLIPLLSDTLFVFLGECSLLTPQFANLMLIHRYCSNIIVFAFYINTSLF